MKLKDLLKFSNGELVSDNDLDMEISRFSIDSRDIDSNTFFIPLKGEKSDGHDYIKTAFENGAIGTFTSKYIEKEDGKIIIKVNDTLEAIQNVARNLRENIKNIPLIAITGSVGKTTTKDMIYSVLSTKYKTLRTKGNFNNHIGMPLTLINYANEEIIVLEMGMNHLGEVAFLSNIAKPNIGIITNIGHSHIGNLGSRENILKAKMEIVDNLNEDGCLIINSDNDMLSTVKEIKQSLIKIGLKSDSDIFAYDICITEDFTSFKIKEEEKEYLVKINLIGKEFVYNALIAWVIGRIFNISAEDRVKSLENCKLTKMRMNIKKDDKLSIINDCYNASPESMKLALQALSKQEATRKVAILRRYARTW